MLRIPPRVATRHLYHLTIFNQNYMKTFFKKILLVSMIATMLPLGTTFAGGSMPATSLTGSVTSENMIKLSWSTPDKTDYKYIYDFYEGYSVFRDNKLFALLKFSNNNYSYYNLAGLKDDNYDFTVSLYYYDIMGIHHVNQSNKVSLQVSKNIKLYIDQSSSSKVNLKWTSYNGNFDGYIIKLVEIGKNGEDFPKNTISYYVSKTTTSFDGINAAAGHKYRAQIFPYTSNGNGTLNFIEEGKSNRKLVKLESGEIILTAAAVGGKIEASFTASTSRQVDGYAVYVVTGKKGEVSLSNASPVFFSKDKTTFTAYPSDTGYYTLKVYAYNERPDGTKVYHQPGSNWVTVVNNIL